MKVFRACVGHDGAILVQDNDAHVTARQITLREPKRAWRQRLRLPRDFPLQKSSDAALEFFIEERVRAARLLQAEIRTEQRLLQAARDLLEGV